MSVPVNRRSHGKLEAYSKAYELATYTLLITKNKKVFTEEHQDDLTNHLVDAALSIYTLVGSANDMQVRTEADRKNFDERIEMQSAALKKCGDMTRLILLAKSVFHLSSKRVTYWTGLTKETRGLIKAWSDSDVKRFKTLFEDKGV